MTVLYKDFHFLNRKTTKLKKQTRSSTNHLQAIATIRGKIEYDKNFDVFHIINTSNAEMFVKSLEKCELVSRHLSQRLENLDDYGFPKTPDLIVAEEEKNCSWICPSYPF